MSTDKPPAGYKSPPAEHRFQKGQSGNPRGRPRKAAPAARSLERFETEQAALAYRIAKQPVTVRDGDHTKSIPMLEAVLRTEANQAAKGKRLDKKDMLERLAKAEAELLAAKRQDYDDWAMIKAFKIAERKSVPECNWKLPLPHPDDIILGPDFEVSIDGPLNAAELAGVEKSCALRDMLILQSVLDCHCRVKSKIQLDRKDLVPMSIMIAKWIDKHLPRRFRLGHGELERAMDSRLWRSRGDLEDEIRTARRALGLDVGGSIGPLPHLTLKQAKSIFRQRQG